jgi:FMN phosphatase YigB (HAD superfamily)/ribosomal protein L40E
MYFGGAVSSLGGGEPVEEYYMSSSEVRVVSFDLDNCLWKTGATISTANDALADFLSENNVTQLVRVEKVMGELFQESKEKYSPQGGKAPVLLTLLRKDAIQRVLEEHNEYSEEDAKEFADKAFQVWTETRHEVIPSHFASSVVSCLEKIQSIRTSSGQPLLIGAITDGNSDPRNIPELQPFFHFVVNAESVGVSKPDKRVYVEAINQAIEHPFVQDIFGPFKENLSEEEVEDMIGPWWVHIGDDFIKDVVPAKELKMRSIWARELIAKPNEPVTKVDPKKSLEEFVKQVSEKKVIEMTIGADDYLVDSIRSEFADAVVDTFAELGDVLADWQETALRSRVNDGSSAAETENVEVMVVSPKPPAKEPIVVNDEANKFCMYCGTKIPMVAKFCSSCGEKQPDLTSEATPLLDL